MLTIRGAYQSMDGPWPEHTSKSCENPRGWRAEEPLCIRKDREAEFEGMAVRRDREGGEKKGGGGETETSLCFEIRSCPESGLGLYARRDIAEGEVVLEELPFAATVAAAHDRSCCAECLWYAGSDQDQDTGPDETSARHKQLGEAFSPCQGCHVSAFCSSCQAGSGDATSSNPSNSTSSSNSRTTRHPAALCSAYGVLQSLDLSEEEQDDVRFLLSLLWIRGLRPLPPLEPRTLSLWQDFYARTAERAQPREGTPREHLAPQNQILERPQDGRGPQTAESGGAPQAQGVQDDDDAVGVEGGPKSLRPSKRRRAAPSGDASSTRGCRLQVPQGNGRGIEEGGPPTAPGTVEGAGGPTAIELKGSPTPSGTVVKTKGPSPPSGPPAVDIKGPSPPSGAVIKTKGSSPPSDLWALVDLLDKDSHFMLTSEKPRCRRIHQALVTCMAQGSGASLGCTPGSPQVPLDRRYHETVPARDELGRDRGGRGVAGDPGEHPWGDTPLPSLEETAALLSSHERNTFAIMAPHGTTTDMEVRAFAMYPTASLFNHCCYPNLCRFDYLHGPGSKRNAALQLRAMRGIPRGEQLFLSYFPLGWPLPQRQERLRSEYGFTCACPRCALEEKEGDWEGEEEGEEEMDDEAEEEGEGEEEEEEQGGGGSAEEEDTEQVGPSVTLDGAVEERKVEGREGQGKGGGEGTPEDTEQQGKRECAVHAREELGAANGTVHSREEGEGRVGLDQVEHTEEEDEDGGAGECAGEDTGGGEEGGEGGCEDTWEGELAHAMYFRKHLCALEGCRGTVCACVPFTGATRVASTSGINAEPTSSLPTTTFKAERTVVAAGAVIAPGGESLAAGEEEGDSHQLTSSGGQGSVVAAMEEEVMGTLCDFYECNACGKIWTRAEWARHIAESFQE